MREQPRILIVDDNSVDRFTLETLFHPEDYNLLVLNSPQNTLAVVDEFLPDVILLDVMMSDMDGFEICRRLRENSKTTDIPITLLASLDDQSTRLRGFESGADNFIAKPYSRLELQAHIRTLTHLNRFRRLLAEKSKFERIVEQAEIGYLLIDDRDQILFANPFAHLYLDSPRNNDQAVGESFLTLVKKLYRCQPTDAWLSWPEPPPEQTTRYLVRPESETSQVMWVKVETLGYLAEEIKPTWLVSLQDVTGEIASQRDRRKFHTMITHKMRTPFISVLTGLELLIKHIDNLSPPEIADLSLDAYKWAKRLFGDIEDILRYVNTSALIKPGAEYNLTLLPFTVTNICANMDIQEVMISGLENHISLRIALSKAALEIILWEIIGNAKKFHPQQQPVIEVSVVCDNPGEVTIHISDNGLTLSPEQLVHTWEPYYQGEKHFTGQMEGMGLGLSLVASIVWSVGGRCHIYNRANRPGLTVDITLPISSQTEKLPEELMIDRIQIGEVD